MLFVAVLALWVRSYWRINWLTHIRPGRQTTIVSGKGHIVLHTIGDTDVPIWPGPRGWALSREPPNGDGWAISHIASAVRTHRFLGFEHTDIGSVATPTRRLTILAIPYWSLALPPLIAPTIALVRVRRRRRRLREHHCLGCGYDLRASRERCPECGTPIPPDAEPLATSLTPAAR